MKCKAWFNNIHTDKIQSVMWNQKNDQVLLTAGYDRKINILDVKSQKDGLSTLLPAEADDIEKAIWHPTMEHNFVAATESGHVFGFDTRKMNSPLFKF